MTALNRKAYFYLCVTTFFWGGNSVAGKLAIGHVSPMMLTTLRWLVARSGGPLSIYVSCATATAASR